MSQFQSLFELPIFVGGHYLRAFVFFAAAWSVGRQLTRRMRYRDELEAAVVSIALGLGTWSTALFLLATIGLFNRTSVLLLLVASQIWSLRCWTRAYGAIRAWSQQRRTVAWTVGIALAALLLAPLLTLPLYPPIDFDATMFHLPLASSIAESQRIDFFEDLRYPVFPALQEVLYATAMLFGDDVSPSVVHFVCFLAVAVLLYSWGTWVSSRRAGVWAALLWLGTTAGLKAAMGAYVDCALALYVTTAFLCLHHYARDRHPGWLATAGALVGFAAATKYHGLYFLTVITLSVAVYTLWHRRFRHLLGYALMAFLAVTPWYGFIYYHTANPLFPFFPAAFGVSPWAYELRYTGEMISTRVDTGPFEIFAKMGRVMGVLWNKAMLMFDRSLLSTLKLPVSVFRETNPFSGNPLSPLFLAALPPIGYMVLRFRRARYLCLVSGLYLVAWAATAQDLRYLLPVLPILALLGAEGTDRIVEWIGGRSRPWIGRLIALGITVPLILQVHQTAAQTSWWSGRPPTTEAQRHRFLDARLRPYAAIRHMNERYGEDYKLYALFCENMKHFVDGEHLGDWLGPERYARLLGKLRNRDTLHRTLTRLGAEYFLVPDLDTWKQRLKVQFPLLPPEELAPHFEIVYRDRFTTVFRVVPLEAIPGMAQGTAEPDTGESGVGSG